MDKTENNQNYILTEIKYHNFYILYNGIDKKTNKQLKDIVHDIINEKQINKDDYGWLIHEELVNVCYDLLKKQLKLIYDYFYSNDETLYFNDEYDLNKIYIRLPKNIIALIEKNASGTKKNIGLKEVIKREKGQNILLYQIMAYNDSIREILEMFFETKKYEEMRKKFLERDEGKLEALLLEQVKLNKLN